MDAGDLSEKTELLHDHSTRTLREAFRLVRWAHLRLAAPEHWTQHVWARDSRGKEVDAASDHAVCWCAGGAILAANSDLYVGRGEVEISVDRRTDKATMILRPRRVVAALEAVGIGFTEAIAQRIAPPPVRAPSGVLARQHATLLATDINDLPWIKQPHVALALAWTMAALQDQIDRRASRRASAGGQQ